MHRNVGTIERILRIVVGLALIALVFVTVPTPWGALGLTVWGWIGVVPLLTGLIGWCPPYALFGISTCKRA